MKQLVNNGEDLGGRRNSKTNAPRPLTARVEVKGAGESRLNGIYRVQFATKDRVEFEKVDDDKCQIFWSSWQDEWRMLIGDYKMGSTLYRNKYRPNWKADDCHGCPVDNWQKWFGKDGDPTVRLIPEDEPEATVESDIKEDSGGADLQADQTAETAETAGTAGESVKKTTEFLELHSKLDIVSVDDGAARRSAASGVSAVTGSREIS